MSISFDDLEKVHTVDDVTEFLRSIDMEVGSLYRLGEGNERSDSEKRRKLDELKAALKAIPRVTLTVCMSVPREVQEDVWKTVSNWVKGPVVVDIKINPRLLGGAQVEYMGKYYDGSIISKVDRVLTEYAQI